MGKSAIIIFMRDKVSEILIEKVVDEFTRLRKEQGWSHQTLADKVGVSRPAISYIESHKRTPTILTCAKIARALGVRLADIIDKFEK